ncbi:hypothetical protein GCM10027288_12960 [Bordetella tumbae]
MHRPNTDAMPKRARRHSNADRGVDTTAAAPEKTIRAMDHTTPAITADASTIGANHRCCGNAGKHCTHPAPATTPNNSKRPVMSDSQITQHRS